VFPHYGLLVEGLRVSSAAMDWESDKVTRFCSFRWTVLGVYTNTLDANPQPLALEGHSVHVTRTSRGSRLITGVENGGEGTYDVGTIISVPRVSELIQVAVQERGTCRLEGTRNLQWFERGAKK